MRHFPSAPGRNTGCFDMFDQRHKVFPCNKECRLLHLSGTLFQMQQLRADFYCSNSHSKYSQKIVRHIDVLILVPS